MAEITSSVILSLLAGTAGYLLKAEIDKRQFTFSTFFVRQSEVLADLYYKIAKLQSIALKVFVVEATLSQETFWEVYNDASEYFNFNIIYIRDDKLESQLTEFFDSMHEALEIDSVPADVYREVGSGLGPHNVFTILDNELPKILKAIRKSVGRLINPK